MNYFLWVFMLLIPATTLAQAPAAAPDSPSGHKEIRDLSTEDYVSLHLPPLHTLLENARERSPQVNAFAAQREFEERALKTIRRDWMNYFKLTSSFSYGTTDTNSQIFYENNQFPMVQNISGSTQRWWNVGAAFNMPIGDLFNRRNRAKQQQQRVNSIQYQVDSWYDDVCLKIVECYTRIVSNLAILPQLSSTMIVAKAQYITTQSDYINGKLDAQTLSFQKNIENNAVIQYEQIRRELTKDLLSLEILSKTPIISRPEDIPTY